MPGARVAAITSGSALGETIRVPPAACTCATSATVRTVPAPISARSPKAATIAAIEVDRIGRVQRHLDPGDSGLDQGRAAGRPRAG
jgi:hypothetical protein